MINDVYNRRIIELAGNIPRIGRLADPDATATALLELCGSTVTIDLKMDGDTVTDFAHEVKACALGQASSSIMASNIVGSNASELRALRENVRKMLKDNGAPPADGNCADIAVPRAGARLQGAARLDDAHLRRRCRCHRPDRGESRRQGRGGMTGHPAQTLSLGALFDASRRAPRLAGRGLIKVYRYTLSPLVGYDCRHLPTCSDYGDQAIERYGLWAGGWMTLARLLRCQPFGTSGLDFVPATLPTGAHWYLPWRYARWRGTNPGPASEHSMHAPPVCSRDFRAKLKTPDFYSRRKTWNPNR